PVGPVRPPLVDPTPEQESRLRAILDAGLELADRFGATPAPAATGTTAPDVATSAEAAVR
ncbi:MAG TPA: hypothetical protein VFR16_14615, partial [Agromyces mariniharenae]|nr:hypothetical protein [Agromyces mariniharenae]